MNIAEIKKLGTELTGVKITSEKYEGTRVTHDIDKINGKIKTWINIDEHQLNSLKDEFKARKLNWEHRTLVALLHEVGHLKKSKKYKDIWDFDKEYRNNNKYQEALADRYARLNYKRFIKTF